MTSKVLHIGVSAHFYTQIYVYVCPIAEHLLEGGLGPLWQTALHQIVSQLSEVEQFLSVVLNCGRNQLSLQAKGKNGLRLYVLLPLCGERQNW